MEEICFLENKEEVPEIKASWKRWIVLGIFASYSLMSAFQWIQFMILPDIFTEFYSIPETTLAWTSMIYMAVFLPLVFPSMAIIENVGLRKSALLGSFFNALGAALKIFAAKPGLFWLILLAQFFNAVAETLVLALPPKIAGLWFPASQISTATSLGVFGNQLGIALGFYIPTLLIKGVYFSTEDLENENLTKSSNSSMNFEETGEEIKIFLSTVAGICVFEFLLVVFLFPSKPEFFANKSSYERAQLDDKQASPLAGFLSILKRLLLHKSFILLLLNYGLIVGVYYAVSTLLSQLVSDAHESSQVGLMGAIMVITGLFGSVLGGILLDKTKKFKMISIIFYALTLICCAVFTGVLSIGNLASDFLLIGALGFFMTGYLPIGFEFAAELTYPEPEAISSGLLNWAGMTFGLVTTQICQVGIVKLGVFPTCGILLGMLVIGLCFLFAIKEDLRRQKIEEK
ncbi:unnamed protein product [Oikopleura dioica]|uniref:Major facilitator superfamily (MFS) profile domain-containing protein n=1 Tax=Oikopleura dioica TaxID=34765 RepID=E4Y7T7_OIKDI|nr:unnamed protein product [Oikopleura dioica]